MNKRTDEQQKNIGDSEDESKFPRDIQRRVWGLANDYGCVVYVGSNEDIAKTTLRNLNAKNWRMTTFIREDLAGAKPTRAEAIEWAKADPIDETGLEPEVKGDVQDIPAMIYAYSNVAEMTRLTQFSERSVPAHPNWIEHRYVHASEVAALRTDVERLTKERDEERRELQRHLDSDGDSWSRLRAILGHGHLTAWEAAKAVVADRDAWKKKYEDAEAGRGIHLEFGEKVYPINYVANLRGQIAALEAFRDRVMGPPTKETPIKVSVRSMP